MKTILFPLIYLLQILFLFLSKITGSYGIALLLLSLLTSLIMAWLGKLIKGYPEREALVQSLMAPRLLAIRQETKAEKRHQKTADL